MLVLSSKYSVQTLKNMQMCAITSSHLKHHKNLLKFRRSPQLHAYLNPHHEPHHKYSWDVGRQRNKTITFKTLSLLFSMF